MEDHNQVEETQLDTPQNEAVVTEEQSHEEKLLAGKFKSKEALIESTSNLVKQVEGRDMTPSEVLALANKSEDELESTYKGLERQFHTKRPQTEETDDGELEQAYKVLDSWAEKNGFVRKQELEAQRYEESELNSYFAQNPSAKTRADLIKTLSKTDGFKDKSFADIDKFVLSQIPQAEKETVRKEKLGNSLGYEDPGKSPETWTPEYIREQMQKSTGAPIIKR